MTADVPAEQTEVRYDTAEGALARRSVQLVRDAGAHPGPWMIRLKLAGKGHEASFASLKTRPLDLPAALSHHLVGFTGGEELLPVPQRGFEAEGMRTPAEGAGASSALTAMLLRHSDQLLVADLAVRLDLPDAVHQLRMTCRSMRALLKAAGPFLKGSRRRAVNARLKALAAVCAPARDAEVTAELLHERLEYIPAEQLDSVAALRERALAEYAESVRVIRRLLRQKEHLELLMDIEAFGLNPPLTGRAMKLTARQLADELLRRSLRSVRRSAAQAPHGTASPAEAALHRAHEVRKAAKSVRYVASALHHAGMKPRKKLRKAARTARRYQRELGVVIDSSVVFEWLSRGAADQAGEGDRYGIGLVQGSVIVRYQDSLGRVGALIDEFLARLAKDCDLS